MNIAEKKVETDLERSKNKLKRRNSLLMGIGLKDEDE